jgi:hypothetical protein
MPFCPWPMVIGVKTGFAYKVAKIGNIIEKN